jgi:DNA-binding NarL/FixJ family response regulator
LSGPRVLLADDHSFLLKAVAALLCESCKVVGVVSDGAALVSEAIRLNPDVIVTDITMPVLSGIDAVRQIKESGSKARIVILTVHSEDEFVKTCLAEGALGYVHKSRMKAHLIPAIQEAFDGRSYISLPRSD